MVGGQARRTARNRKARDQWTVVIRDHQPGYITWEQYERNQQLMAENRYVRYPAARLSQSLLSKLGISPD